MPSDAQWWITTIGPWLASQPSKQPMQQQPMTSLAPWPQKKLGMQLAIDGSWWLISENYIHLYYYIPLLRWNSLILVDKGIAGSILLKPNHEMCAAQHQAIKQTEKKKIPFANSWPLITTASSCPLRLATVMAFSSYHQSRFWAADDQKYLWQGLEVGISYGVPVAESSVWMQLVLQIGSSRFAEWPKVECVTVLVFFLLDDAECFWPKQ